MITAAVVLIAIFSPAACLGYRAARDKIRNRRRARNIPAWSFSQLRDPAYRDGDIDARWEHGQRAAADLESPDGGAAA